MRGISLLSCHFGGVRGFSPPGDYNTRFLCHQAQGYLFSRPVPAEDFSRLLERNSMMTV